MTEQKLRERIKELDDQVILLSGLLDSAIREKIMTDEVLDRYLGKMEDFIKLRQTQSIDVLKAKIRDLENKNHSY
jgi:hypothetical protein